MSERTIPMHGTDLARRATAAAGLIEPNEIHTTTQFRLFMQNMFIGPVWHGVFDNKAAVANYLLDAARGCWPGDIFFRLDSRSFYQCATGDGQSTVEDFFLVETHNTTFGGFIDDVAPVATLSGGGTSVAGTKTRHGGFFRPTISGGKF